MKDKLKKIFKLLASYKPHFLISLFILFLTSAFEYLFLSNFLQIFNQLSEPGGNSLTDQFLYITLTLFLLKIVSQIFGTLCILKSVEKLSLTTASNTMKKSLGKLTGSGSKSIVKSIQSDVFYFGEFIKTTLFVIQDAAIFFAASIVISKALGVYGTLAFIFAFALFALLGFFLKDFLITLGSRRANVLVAIVSNLIEFNMHWNIIQTSKKENKVFTKLHNYFGTLYKIDFLRSVLAAVPKNLSEILILLILGLWVFFPADDSKVILGILLIAVMRVFPIIGRMLANIQTALFNYSSIENLTNQSSFQSLTNKKVRANTGNLTSNLKLSGGWGEIVCGNLHISIEDQILINGLSIKIKNGDKVALIGQNGSGKSTLIKVLMGFQTDEIIKSDLSLQIDGSIAGKLTDHINISYISQTSAIFTGTIYENITLNFGSQVTDGATKEILASSLMFSEFELVKKIDEDFLKKEVSPESPVLSGGEWQILSIIRALYNNYKFLIIDEGNSALDENNSENLLRILCSKPDLTLIFVNHRHRSNSLFDKVVDLNAS